MALKDMAVRNATLREKDWKLADGGGSTFWSHRQVAGSGG